MTTILDLRPVAVPGWRVAVALAVPALGGRPERVTVTELPLVGWAHTRTADNDVLWLPCWYDDLGLTVGNPWQEIAWPLGPGEDLTGDLRASLIDEARALLVAKTSDGHTEPVDRSHSHRSTTPGPERHAATTTSSRRPQ